VTCKNYSYLEFINVDEHLHLSSGSQVLDKITRAHPEIVQYIDFITVMPYFNRYKIFTSDETHAFSNAIHATNDKVNSLIQYLSRKNEEGVLNFVKALDDAKEHSGHDAILRKLKVKVINGKVYDEEMQEHT